MRGDDAIFLPLAKMLSRSPGTTDVSRKGAEPERMVNGRRSRERSRGQDAGDAHRPAAATLRAPGLCLVKGSDKMNKTINPQGFSHFRRLNSG